MKKRKDISIWRGNEDNKILKQYVVTLNSARGGIIGRRYVMHAYEVESGDDECWVWADKLFALHMFNNEGILEKLIKDEFYCKEEHEPKMFKRVPNDEEKLELERKLEEKKRELEQLQKETENGK